VEVDGETEQYMSTAADPEHNDLIRVVYRRLPALRSRNFRLFWFGQMISLTGTWIQSVAQQWLVLQLTHSAFQVGLIVTVQFLPLLLLVLFTGPVADRANKRDLLLATQIGSMILAALLGFLTQTHHIRYWHILAIAGALGTINAFYTPTRQSFVSQLVPVEDLLNAVALNSTIFNGARVLGPAIGGLLYGAVGPAIAFYLNAVSYLAVIAGLLLIPAGRSQQRVEHRIDSYIADLAEGFRYVSATTTVLVILLLVGIASTFALNFTTLLPVFARFVLHVGSSGYGLLQAAQGAGALAGAIVLSFWTRRRSVFWLIYGGAFAFLVLELDFAFTRIYPLAAILLLFIGFFSTLFTTTANTRILEITPKLLQGRVMSVYSLMFLGVTPIGSILSGAVAQRFGAPIALAGGSVISLVATAIIFTLRLRARERTRRQIEAEARE
jgi:MFS family permease